MVYKGIPNLKRSGWRAGSLLSTRLNVAKLIPMNRRRKIISPVITGADLTPALYEH